MKTHTESLQNLAAVLAQEPGLAFAALVGSRATGNHRPDSDWDIALMWRDGHALQRSRGGPAAVASQPSGLE